MLRHRLFVALVLVSLAAACSGGGGGGGSSAPSAPTAVGTQAPALTGTATAAFTITVPPAPTGSSRTRTPRVVPSNTKSIRFTLLKSDNASATTPAVSPAYPLVPGSTGCTSSSSGTTCTVQIQAPVGTDIFVADIFATTDGSGTKIGSGSVRMTVLDNAVNTASLSLAGKIASVVISTDDFTNYQNTLYPYGELITLQGTTLPGSTQTIPTSARIFVSALDAQGNQIISPDTFDTPVTLTIAYYTGSLYNPLAGSARAPRATGPSSSPSPSPSPSPAPQSFANIAVTYAFPQNGVTSASSGSGGAVQVLSPADKTVITPLGTTTQPIQLMVTASLGSTVQQTFLVFLIFPNQCPQGYSGSPPFSCVAPSPSPTPTPALFWQSQPGETSAYATFVPAASPSPAAVEFNSLPAASPRPATSPSPGPTNGYIVQIAGPAATGTSGSVSIDASACTNFISVSPTGSVAQNGQPINVTLINQATAAMSCVVHATSVGGAAPGSAADLKIFVDNYGVTVQ
ncbi:MAG: hypothetical protein JOZ24_01685 [Candidatus Eremiobacteraeota bacterium]|nr:hypothetical protein [Candidatus Eremiobacteraeota bacterium]